jgi:hypothetical protein
MQQQTRKGHAQHASAKYEVLIYEDCSPACEWTGRVDVAGHCQGHHRACSRRSPSSLTALLLWWGKATTSQRNRRPGAPVPSRRMSLTFVLTMYLREHDMMCTKDAGGCWLAEGQAGRVAQQTV